MTDMPTADEERERHRNLIAAEASALALLDAIEAGGLIAPGRSEREVEQDILRLAEERFGVEKHWHKRIVRAGANTLAVAGDNPPIRVIGEDDMVFVDLGPVFEEWEADVGRSYAVGGDPRKAALVAALPVQFEAVKRHFLERPDISGADLYAFACRSAEQAGWRFGGTIAGTSSANFPMPAGPASSITAISAPRTRRGCAIGTVSAVSGTGSWKSTSCRPTALSVASTSGCSSAPEAAL
ncbi:M24 family metallopeptidase [Sphingomonas oligoaromativorans]|uniref:M24 family metallopeptidase n=1 Tax=Sphingomonas oligoaromativorans TaxID=575322 RepID=UPI001ABA0D73|nr:M24 family metallopeptidase [Sphingomonas oligoaromativorans]NIJ33329.1 hypothetical protein [Sphingomonas oligoaromativorans]